MLQIKNYAISSDWLPMVGSQAQGMSLVKDNNFAADMLKFDPHEKTSLHTHPGNHILFIVQGYGYLLFDGNTYNLTIGTCYFVPGNISHQVIADDDGLFLLSISDNHKTVDSPERLEVLSA